MIKLKSLTTVSIFLLSGIALLQCDKSTDPDYNSSNGYVTTVEIHAVSNCVEGYPKAQTIQISPGTYTAKIITNNSSYGPTKFSGVFFIGNGLLEKIMYCAREDQSVTFTVPSNWSWQQGISCFVIDGRGYLGDNSGSIPVQFNQTTKQVHAVNNCVEGYSKTKTIQLSPGTYTAKTEVNDDQVTFKWRDYRDGKVKLMTLKAFEFIRRFLMHVLPKGFFKIRYYGILASRNLKTKLKRCKELLGISETKNQISLDNWRFRPTSFYPELSIME